MTIEDDIAFLGRVPILQRLGAGALRILAIGAENYTVQAGQMLFEAGETADCAYIIEHGSFTLTPQRAGDSEAVAGPGTLLGESALLAETQRPATAIAREDSTVHAHLARHVLKNARKLSGSRAAAARTDRFACRPMGPRNRERPRRAGARHRAAVLASTAHPASAELKNRVCV